MEPAHFQISLIEVADLDGPAGEFEKTRHRPIGKGLLLWPWVFQPLPEQIDTMPGSPKDMGDGLRDLAQVVVGLNLASKAILESFPEDRVFKALLWVAAPVQDESIGRDGIQGCCREGHANRGEPRLYEQFSEIVHSHFLSGIPAK
jgi:hypothetical protein